MHIVIIMYILIIIIMKYLSYVEYLQWSAIIRKFNILYNLSSLK